MKKLILIVSLFALFFQAEAQMNIDHYIRVGHTRTQIGTTLVQLNISILYYGLNLTLPKTIFTRELPNTNSKISVVQ